MVGLHLALHSLEAMGKLLKEILDNALVVVAPAQDVIKCRETVGLAGLLLLVELFGFKLVVADDTPVIACRIHGETRRQRSINANDHRVLTGAAVPGKAIS